MSKDSTDGESGLPPSKLSKEEKEVKKLIKELSKFNLKQGASKKIRSEQDLEYIGTVLCEFLDCFVVLGYDMEGNDVEIHAAFNQQQSDSLRTKIIDAAARVGM